MYTVVLGLVVLVPMLGSLLAFIMPDDRRLCFSSTLAAVVASFILLLVLGLSHSHPTLFWPSRSPPLFAFYVDWIGFILGVVVLSIGILVLIYSYHYLSPLNREHRVVHGYSRYYGLMCLFIASMMGVALSYSWLTLFFFYELTGICSCLLIAYYLDEEGRMGGIEALVLTHIGGLALLALLVLLYHEAHSLLLPAVSKLRGAALVVAGLLALVACIAKSAQLPLHFWLPDAMVAPTTVSAYLHAAAMVKVGVFTMIRFAEYAPPVGLHVVGVAGVVVSLATAFYAAYHYYSMRDLKGLLAYSTIAQLSYILAAVSFSLLGSRYGLYAAIYHVWNHSFTKAALFLCAGAVAYAYGSRSLSLLEGLSRVKGFSLVAACWIAASLSLIGVPPLGCFYSKLAIIVAGLSGGILCVTAAILLLVESVLCFIVFARTCMMVLSKHHPSEPLSKPSTPMSLVLAVLALMAIVSPYLMNYMVGV